MSRRVLVVGAGAIGTLIAGKLATRPDTEVVLASRRPLAEVTLESDGERRVVPVRVVVSPHEVGAPVDWVVVACKAYDTDGLRPWLDAAAESAPWVGVAQNGIEQVDRVAEWVTRDRAVALIVSYGAERPAPGQVVETVSGAVRVPVDAAGEAFAELAAGSQLAVELVDDFVTALWTKLAWNVVGNSLTTLTDVPVREVGRQPRLRALGMAMAEECRRVADAEGAALPADIATSMLETIAQRAESVTTSMWQDLQAGRPLEHDAITGAVVRAAERHGVEVPHARMADALLSVLSSRGR